MKLEKLRNIGIIAHIDAGKTTTSERFLFLSGKIHRMGEVHDGDTTMDWRVDEQERGITIVAAASTIYWNDTTITLIDTPGHVDFTAEVERSLRVMDGAILVLCGVAGVEAQSETVWRQANRYGVPRIAYVNKLDRAGASFDAAVDSMRERLGAHPICIQRPVHAEDGTVLGVIDLVRMRYLTFEGGRGAEVIEHEIPADAETDASAGREALIEALCDLDDELAEHFLEGHELDADTVMASLRKSCLACTCTPVLAGTSLRNVGVPPLLDAVIDYLPAPTDLPPVAGTNPRNGQPEERSPTPDAPMSALVFKVQAQTGGEIFYLRVYSGTLEAGSSPINARDGKREKIHDLLRMHAKSGDRIKAAGPGEIVAVPGLKRTVTGDTLHEEGKPIAFEEIAFPDPVVSLAVEPKTAAGRDKLEDALRKMTREDPTFTVSEDEETGQVVLSGMGELHLEIVTNRLATEFKVEANVGRPRVAYREAIHGSGEIDHERQRNLGGRVAYGGVKLLLEPSDELEVVWKVPTKPPLPKGMKNQVIEHLEGELAGTGLFGYTLLGGKVTVLEIRIREIDPEGMGIPFALSEAFVAGLEKVRTDVLEPIMSLEIHAHQEYVGAVHQSLQAKRATISSMDESGGLSVIRGSVPMSEMFGYPAHIRSLSQGRASFALEPAGFAAIAPDVVERMFGS